jgi:hypothetical protein
MRFPFGHATPDPDGLILTRAEAEEIRARRDLARRLAAVTLHRVRLQVRAASARDAGGAAPGR